MKEHTVYYSPIKSNTKKECLLNVKKIQSSLVSMKMTTEEIVYHTSHGYSLQFGTNDDQWKSQSIFGIDIDSFFNITIRQLLNELKKYKLYPFAIFTTLSNADLLNPTRLRLYFALNNPVTEHKIMHRIIRYVCDIINRLSPNSIDYQCTNTGRIFFPGHLVYSAPEKKILLKNIAPIADLLYGDNKFFLDRNQFMKELHGIPGTVFFNTQDIPDLILIGTEKNDDNVPVVKFLEAQKCPLLYRIRTISPLSIKNILTNRCSNISKGSKRYICSKTFVGSNAQKSTEDKLYYAKVYSIYLKPFISALLHYLKTLTDDSFFIYENIKKNEANFESIKKIFKIQEIPITKDMVIQNLNEYHNFTVNKISQEYPSLQKLLNKSGRYKIISIILTKAIEQLSYKKYQAIYYQPQYAISKQFIAAISKKERKNIAHLFNLFSYLGLLQPIQEEYYNKAIIKDNPAHSLPTVLMIPWFDSILLSSAESKSAEFLRTNKTMHGLGKIDIENDKIYLATENCVISLLKIRPYFTRSMLVKTIEMENICAPGKKGDNIANKYLPAIVKKLHLSKENYTKHIESFLPVPDKDLTYGSSILYFREDLLTNDRNNKINS